VIFLKPSIIFLVASVSVWLVSFPLYHQLLGWRLVDRPNNRSSHLMPTPRGGGLGIVAVLGIGLFLSGLLQDDLFSLVLLCCTLLIAGISLIDDIKNLSPLVRFVIQIATATLLVVWLRVHEDSSSAERLKIGFGWGVVTVAWIVGYTNAFNFMDGINGISGGQATIAGLGTGAIAGLLIGTWTDSTVVISFLLAGAAAGFLPHNFPRARMFMGDVGSATVGFVLAALSVEIAVGAGGRSVIPLLVLHANYVLDTGITMTRRICRGDRFYEPHREHFYQRLVRAGKSHTFVTLAEMTLQIICLFLALGCIYAGNSGQAAVAAIVVLLWLLFFAYAEILFKKATQRAIKSKELCH
jgi:UDP-GlcNAc:undecaprenyl-phosphate/decaprenyl-phosphate GlcNAc-1-phosphate transferase